MKKIFFMCALIRSENDYEFHRPLKKQGNWEFVEWALELSLGFSHLVDFTLLGGKNYKKKIISVLFKGIILPMAMTFE